MDKNTQKEESSIISFDRELVEEGSKPKKHRKRIYNKIRKAKLVFPKNQLWVQNQADNLQVQHSATKEIRAKSALQYDNCVQFLPESPPQYSYPVPALSQPVVGLSFSNTPQTCILNCPSPTLTGSFSIIQRGNIPSISTFPFPYQCQ